MILKVKHQISELLVALRIPMIMQWLRLNLLRKPQVIILCYHRIIESGGLISPQCISSEMFDSQLKFFSSRYNVVSLDDVASYLLNKQSLVRDAVVITFDDGYEDNFLNALPLLKKHKVCACFFIASNPIILNKNYWIDELSSMLEMIDFTKEFSDNKFLKEITPMLYKLKNATSKTHKSLAKQIFIEFNKMDEFTKSKALKALRDVCYDKAITTPNLMTINQIKKLQTEGHLLGGHSVTHPRLSNLSKHDVEQEIAEGIIQLRACFEDVRYFAYPFGKKDDLPRDVDHAYKVLAHQDIELAVTTEDRSVSLKGTHRYMVPRKVVSPQSLSQVELKMEMIAWQGILKSNMHI